MATRIKHKRSAVSGNIPAVAQLEAGELALNTADGKVYLKNDADEIVDITKSIYQRDTNVTVEDDGTNPGTVTVTTDNVEQVSLASDGIQLKNNVSISNGQELQLKELSSNGNNYVALRAPDSLIGNYTLKLPTATGLVGQTLATDGAGNLEFVDADVFGGNRVYVSATKGSDLNDGVTKPVATVKRALQIASGMVYDAQYLFDEALCSRDVGLITDAIGWDLVYGSNWQSVKAAKTYYNSVASEVVTTQKTLTVDALTYYKDLILATQSGAEATVVEDRIDTIINIVDNGLGVVPAVTMPDPAGADAGYTAAKDLILANIDFIADEIIEWTDYQVANNIAPFTSAFTYNETACRRDARYIAYSVAYDLLYGGNQQTVDAALKYFDGLGNTITSFITGQETETAASLTRAKYVVQQVAQSLTGWTKYTALTQTTGTAGSSAAATDIGSLYDIIIDVVTNGVSAAPSVTNPTSLYSGTLESARNALLADKTEYQARTVAYAAAYRPNGTRVIVQVAAGDYVENNPIIVPDNVSVIGDGLRACIIRPLNANKDMLRVRNGCYFTEFTFRDGLGSGVPTYTWDYAVSFDDVADTETDRAGYTGLPVVKPTITTSPYVQNCSIISFLGGNGVLVDGEKIVTTNTAENQIEVENPVSGPAPAQGKSMVANAFTMLSFGGTGWRVINEAYVQIVSCFQIFMLNGTYTQSGGYCSITNSATNFGLYALRASGYSPNAFSFDKGYIGTTGADGSIQTVTAFGFQRPDGPVEEFVVKIYDPSTNADLTGSFKTELPTFLEVTFDAAVAPNVSTNLFTINSHGFNNGDAVTYDTNGGLKINGLFNGEVYYVKYIDSNSFSLCYDDSLTRIVDVRAVSSGTQKFVKQDYEMIVGEVTEKHTTFQDLVLDAGSPSGYTFAPGDVLVGQTIGLPNNAYVYAYDSVTRTLTVAINKVTIGVSEVRNVFDAASSITEINGSSVSYTVTSAAARTDLNAATFQVVPTIVGGAFTDVSNLKGKKIWFHRPSITNSSSHTWEYAGSGTDYNALPQNGGQTVPRYEQYKEGAGKVYTSGTNELGDFKVGDFITAYNRTGNITFRNKVTVDTLDVLRIGLGGVTVEELSTDIDLGENEIGGPKNSRISTQLAVWSYANNRLGPFIDKSITTSAVPGSLVQLNSNGQINTDLIPTQRNFTSFISNGYGSRLRQIDNIPAGDMQAGDIATENFEQTELTLNAAVGGSGYSDGDLVVQPSTGATGYLKGDYGSGSTTMIVASVYDSFGTTFATGAGNTLTIAGVATGVYPTAATTPEESTGNYFLRGATTSQYLILPNSGSYTFTDADISTAFRYNNKTYIKTSAAHDLVSNTYVKINAATNSYDANALVTVLDSDEFYYDNTAADSTASATTTATATLAGATGATTMTGSVTSAALSGTITLGDFVFDSAGTIPLGSKITAVNMAVNPRTFTITFPAASTVASTTTATLSFFTPASETGTVRSIITAADSLSQGEFTELRTGVLTSVNNITLTSGSGYVAGIYYRVPLTNVSSSGSGALADITVDATGGVTDVDLIYGGTGYASGDTLSASNTNLGGTGSGFQITATAVEQRAYVTILGGQLFVATQTAPDFAEDNAAARFDITATATTVKTFDAAPTGGGGNVDYTTNYITINSHGLSNGDPVKYDPTPNAAMGGLITGNVYYVKVVDSNTIQLCATYNVASVSALPLGPSSTGNHTITRYSINTVDDSIYEPAHGLTTGQAVRVFGNDLFYIDGTQVPEETRFFAGSITTNSFTLHELRADAVLSVGGNVTNAYDITATGSNGITFVAQNVQVNGTVNTSSSYKPNWNSLVSTNIDASNIISGVVATSRLGGGTASSDTFLRGDSVWSTAVKSVAVAAGSPLTALGSGSSPFWGDITLDIIKADSTGGAAGYSSMGAASFNLTQFAVGAGDSIDPGQVYIKNGVVDAGTLDTYDSAYFLNPANLTSAVPVNRGGTGLSLYNVGDMLYTTGATSFNTLNIGNADTVLTSTGTAPQWSSKLTMAEEYNTNAGTVATTSTTTGSMFEANAKTLNIGLDATSVTIGSNTASEDLASRVASYTAATTTSVTVNLGSVNNSTNLATLNGAREIKFSATTGAKVGMLVTGVGSIPAGTYITGVTATSIYLSQALTGSITLASTLTFNETPRSLGVKVGDKVTIASSGVTNLDGTWPVTAASATATSFTVLTNANVTASAVARAGTIARTSNTQIKTRNLTLGAGEGTSSPTDATIKSGDATGTNATGSSLYIRSGSNTGSNVTGGYIYIQTPTSTSSGATQQAIATRVTIAPNGTVTFANNVTMSGDLAVNGGDITTTATTFNLLNATATTVNFAGAGTAVTVGATTGYTNIRNALTVQGAQISTATAVTGITTTATAVDSWSATTYRTAKYVVQVAATAGTDNGTF